MLKAGTEDPSTGSYATVCFIIVGIKLANTNDSLNILRPISLLDKDWKELIVDNANSRACCKEG